MKKADIKRAVGCLNAGKRETRPILSCVRLSASSSQGVLYCETTDLETTVRIALPYEHDLQPVCVPCADFKAALDRANYDMANFTILYKDAGTVSAKVAYCMPGATMYSKPRNPDEFPDLFVKSPKIYEPELLEALIAVSPFASKDSTRFAITGIHLQDKAITATDGHQLARINHISSEYTGIIPLEAIKLAKKGKCEHIGKPNDDLITLCKVTDGVERISIQVRLLDVDFPNCERVYPENSRACYHFSINPKEFKANVKLAKDKKMPLAIVGDGKIMVLSNNTKPGSYALATYETDYYSSDATSQTVNARYLANAFDYFGKGQSVTFHTNDTKNGVLKFTDHNRDYLLMPMRCDNDIENLDTILANGGIPDDTTINLQGISNTFHTLLDATRQAFLRGLDWLLTANPAPVKPSFDCLEYDAVDFETVETSEPIKVKPAVVASDHASDFLQVLERAGGKLEINRAWAWLTFPGKPSDETREAIKSKGFRWARKRKQWFHKDAASLLGETTAHTFEACDNLAATLEAGEPIGQTYSRHDKYGVYAYDGTKMGSTCNCEDYPCCGH